MVVDLDETDRELWEIDENLMRSELSPADIRDHLRRRKVIWEAKEAESGSERPTLTGRGNKGFAAETAAITGMSKRRINRLMAEPKRNKPKPEPAFHATTMDIPDADIMEATENYAQFLAKLGFGEAVRQIQILKERLGQLTKIAAPISRPPKVEAIDLTLPRFLNRREFAAGGVQ